MQCTTGSARNIQTPPRHTLTSCMLCEKYTGNALYNHARRTAADVELRATRTHTH